MKNFRVTVNGNVYEVLVEETAGGAAPAATAPIATAPAVSAPVTAPSPAAQNTPAEKAPAAVSTGAQGDIIMSAPMPGKIIAVKAGAGTYVKKGEVVLILEAMKMENEIVAQEEGTIASVHVTAGSNVESGETLVTINKA
ncbi:MAG: acetyl-CoA carboxylase biotin carboxyl carrier protein subunit [Lacrimispora sp.]|uniref:biotin/lipoyl-containing protein n=1 Tax=Lacrimispora sp. TaxID=2719234 RepID=UPI0039E34111